MLIELAEVEFASEKDDYCAIGGQAAIVARLALGGLEEPVECFQEAIGHSSTRTGDDAFQMTANQLRDNNHGFGIGSHDICAPLLEHGAYDINLLTVENCAQIFLVLLPAPTTCTWS